MERSQNRLTFRKCLSTVLVLSFMFKIGLSMALMGPLFPPEAAKKGVSKSSTGLIVGVFDIVSISLAVFAVPVMQKQSLKMFFCTGYFVLSVTSGLFGFTDLIESEWEFIVACCLIRIVKAFGFSAAFFSIFPLLFSAFPESKGTLTGLTEIFFQLGMITGPSLGSALYSRTGYIPPFIVPGVLGVFLSLLCVFFVSHKPDPETETKKLRDQLPKRDPLTVLGLFCNPRVLITSIPIFLNSNLQGITAVYLAPFMINIIGIHEHYVSYFFLPIAITGLFCSPLAGKIVDCNFKWTLYVLAPVFGAAACLTLMSQLNYKGSLSFYWVILGLIFTGLCYTSSYIAGINVLHEVFLRECGDESHSAVTTIMSAWNSCYITAGRMVGSIVIGGLIFDFAGYKAVLLTQLGLQFVAFVAVVVAFTLRKSSVSFPYEKLAGESVGLENYRKIGR